ASRAPARARAHLAPSGGTREHAGGFVPPRPDGHRGLSPGTPGVARRAPSEPSGRVGLPGRSRRSRARHGHADPIDPVEAGRRFPMPGSGARTALDLPIRRNPLEPCFRRRAWCLFTRTVPACLLLIVAACGSSPRGDEEGAPAEVPTIVAEVAKVNRRTVDEELAGRGTIAALPNEGGRASSPV